MTSNTFLLGIGVTYTLLIARIIDKGYWLVPKHMTEKELYEIAASKGINADAVAHGICHLAMKDGVTLNKAHVLAQLGKILTEARDDASLFTGDREMVDFMSLDDQQFALLEVLERGHYPLGDKRFGEVQNAIMDDMTPEQIGNLFRLLYHQALKLKNMGLLEFYEELKEQGPSTYEYATLKGLSLEDAPKEIPSVLEENIWSCVLEWNWLDIELILNIWL